MQKGNVVLVVVGVALVVILGVWYFVKRDAGSMEKSAPVVMEQKEVPADAMKKIEEDTTSEGTAADKTKDEAMTKKDAGAAIPSTGTMMGGGQYVTYAPEKLAFAKEGKVVLFFRAGWCPTCRALDSDIRAHLGDIPKGVLILDVDYDNSKDLKSKYGITYQHTFVEVDAMGNQIAKWSGSATLSELLAQVK